MAYFMFETVQHFGLHYMVYGIHCGNKLSFYAHVKYHCSGYCTWSTQLSSINSFLFVCLDKGQLNAHNLQTQSSTPTTDIIPEKSNDLGCINPFNSITKDLIQHYIQNKCNEIILIC